MRRVLLSKQSLISQQSIIKHNLEIIRKCFSLLSRKEIRKVKLVAVLQLFLAFVDFVGVIAIGLVGTLSVYGIQSRAPSGQLDWILDFLNLGDLDFKQQVGIVGSIAGFVLISKSFISAWISRRTIFFLSNRSADISNRILHKLTFSSYEQIRKRSRFDNIFALTNGVQSITVGVIGQLISLFSDLVLIVIMFTGLLIVDTSIALVTVILFGGVAYVLYRLVSKKVVNLVKEEADIQIKNGQAIYELFGSYREVFVGGLRERYVERLSMLRQRQAHVAANSRFISDISKYVLEIAFVIGAFAFVGIQFLLKDAVGAISSISVFLASAGRILPAILRVQSAAMAFRGAVGVADRTLVMLDELKSFEPEKLVKQQEDDSKIKGQISVQHVSFKYFGSESNALREISLEVPPGEWVAIVGPSGAGKTTLVDLILGVLKPTQGVVKVCGVSPESAISQRQGQFAYVPQESFIAQGSIEENVAFGSFGKEIDSKKVISCLQKVGLIDLVFKNEKGLKQDVGELGSKLSGGQKQRLGLARALYTNPTIIVLDEATSALDNLSEKMIVDLLNELKGSVTVISIAHRLSTVINADRVVYIENGEIKASGSFDEVRRQVPNFDKQARLGNIEQIP